MRAILHSLIVFLLTGASFSYGAVPSINVIVSDSSGKATYKGATDSKGTFATPTLQAGNYVVQFNSKAPALKGNSYALFISAGKKKIGSGSIAGDKFAGAGVAMKIDVAAGLSIAGQVTSGLQTKVDANGKKLVWIPQKLGSSLPGHWATEDSAEAKEAQTQGNITRQDLQNRENQGIAPVSR